MYSALSLKRTNEFCQHEKSKPERSSRKRPTNSYATRYLNQDRNFSSIKTSDTCGTLRDRIQRERRAHTMAPLARINGPSSTPQANLFASISAPKRDLEMTDDNTPIIVKVRYDPRTGVRPSEQVIRKTLEQQLRTQPKKLNEPIIMNFPTQLPNFISQSRVVLQSTRTFLQKKIPRPEDIPKPYIKRQRLDIPRLPKRSSSTESLYHGMATQKSSSTTVNVQQTLSNRPNVVPPSEEVFRPPSIKDIPELSRENLLTMLNQIPDLQGRQFNIEYALSNAPESYPIPFELAETNKDAYPEPVYTDTLPSNVIQHLKNSNNPAITAALEASLRQEQTVHPQSTVKMQSNYPIQSSEQVQQSRHVSSTDDDSDSTDDSSSETSDSSEEIVQNNNRPFFGPMTVRQNQYR